MQLSEMQVIARRLDEQLKANRSGKVTDENLLDVQMLTFAEEAGELVGAYRRWTGRARRQGDFRAVEDEVADVFIVTMVLAQRLGIDIEHVIKRKLQVIYSRGWHEETADSS